MCECVCVSVCERERERERRERAIHLILRTRDPPRLMGRVFGVHTLLLRGCQKQKVVQLVAVSSSGKVQPCDCLGAGLSYPASLPTLCPPSSICSAPFGLTPPAFTGGGVGGQVAPDSKAVTRLHPSTRGHHHKSGCLREGWSREEWWVEGWWGMTRLR